MSGAGALVVVVVCDHVNPALAGREGCHYASPPQQREQALALVGLLLGRPGAAIDDAQAWTVPIAGG